MWDLFHCRVVEEVHATPLLYVEGDDFKLELQGALQCHWAIYWYASKAMSLHLCACVCACACLADTKAEAHVWASRIAAGYATLLIFPVGLFLFCFVWFGLISIERANKRGAIVEEKASKADKKKQLEEMEKAAQASLKYTSFFFCWSVLIALVTLYDL